MRLSNPSVCVPQVDDDCLPDKLDLHINSSLLYELISRYLLLFYADN